MLTVTKHANGEYSWSATGSSAFTLKDRIYFNNDTNHSIPRCGQGLDEDQIKIHAVTELDDKYVLLVSIPEKWLSQVCAINVVFGKDEMEFKNETEDSSADSHYKALAIEPLEVMRGMMTKTEYKGFLKGNVIKYSIRQGNKKGEAAEKDAAKCREYIRLLNELENPDIPY